MNPVAGDAHQHEEVGRQLLRPHHDPEHEAEGGEVEAGEDVLGEADVGAVAGDVVQPHVEPHEARGVDQGPGVAPQLAVVTGPVDDPLDLLHVGHPVYLRVLDVVDHENVYDELGGEESQRGHPGVAGAEYQFVEK